MNLTDVNFWNWVSSAFVVVYLGYLFSCIEPVRKVVRRALKPITLRRELRDKIRSAAEITARCSTGASCFIELVVLDCEQSMEYCRVHHTVRLNLTAAETKRALKQFGCEEL